MQSLWTSFSALKSSMKWLDSIGNNIANENTPGFAAQNVTFEDALTAAQTPSTANAGQAGRFTSLNMAGGTGVVAAGVESNFSATMPIQQTGRSTDLAIQGPGFFRVSTPNGVELTKAGNFQWGRNAKGQYELATPEGYPVLDVNGQPVIRTGSPNATFSVSPNGQVSFGSVQAQRIAIVEINTPSQTLASAGPNTYAAMAGATPRVVNAGTGAGSGVGAGAGNSVMMQGALSQSNVDLTTAMTDMLQAQQMFQLNSEALQMSNRLQTDANTIKQG